MTIFILKGPSLGWLRITQSYTQGGKGKALGINYTAGVRGGV